MIQLVEQLTILPSTRGQQFKTTHWAFRSILYPTHCLGSKLREKFIWYKLYDGQLLENEAFLFPSSGHTEFGFLEHNGITHSSSSHAR